MITKENRKKAEAAWIDLLTKMCPGNPNIAYYQNKFAEMSDKDFEKLVQEIHEGRYLMPYTEPNFSTTRLSKRNNLALMEKRGIPLRHHVIVDDGVNPVYKTPRQYIVYPMSWNRHGQLLDKKMSIPEDSNVIDQFTGQPTGPSKGSKISFPETQMLSAQGLDKTLEELLKARGGDIEAKNVFDNQLSTRGEVRLEELDAAGGEVRSTTSLRTVFQAMHIKADL